MDAEKINLGSVEDLVSNAKFDRDGGDKGNELLGG